MSTLEINNRQYNYEVYNNDTISFNDNSLKGLEAFINDINFLTDNKIIGYIMTYELDINNNILYIDKKYGNNLLSIRFPNRKEYIHISTNCNGIMYDFGSINDSKKNILFGNGFSLENIYNSFNYLQFNFFSNLNSKDDMKNNTITNDEKYTVELEWIYIPKTKEIIKDIDNDVN